MQPLGRFLSRAVLVAAVIAAAAVLWPRPARTLAPPPGGVVRGGALSGALDSATVRPGIIPQGYGDPTLFLRSLTGFPYGELQLHFVDGLLPDDTEPLEVTREYHSVSAPGGVFGSGWVSNLDERVVMRTGTRIDVREADGATTSYRRDGDGRFVSDRTFGEGALSLDGANVVRRWPDGVEERFDGLGRLLVRGDEHAKEHFFYSGSGTIPVRLADERGRAFTFASDGTHIRSMRDPLGRTIAYDYNDQSLSDTRDSLGRVVAFEYGPAGMSALIDAAGARTAFGYNAPGRLASARGPGYLTADFSWLTYKDEGASVLRSTFGGTQVETATFQPSHDGRRGGYAITQARGGVSNFTATVTRNGIAFADPHGTSWIRIDPSGTVRTSAATAADPPADIAEDWRARIGPGALRAADAHVRYDAAGRPAAIDLGDGTSEVWTWDAADRVSAWRDSAGVVTTYRYDAVNRIVGTERNGRVLQAVTYDGTGLPVTVREDGSPDVAIAYTPAGLPASITSGARRAVFAYDTAGRAVTIDGPDSINALTYDAAGRVATIRNGTQQRKFAYDANGRLSGDTSGTSDLRYQYGPTSTVVTASAFGTPIASERLDRLGDLRQARDRTGTQTFPSADPSAKIDAAGRIISRGSGDSAVRYTYDGAGRLTGIERAAAHTAMTYGAGGTQTVSVRDATGSSTVTFDDLGRQIRADDGDGRPTQFTYNSDGSMAAIIRPGVRLEYAYDPAGRIVAITRSGDSGAAVTRYAYDANGRLIGTVNDDGTIAAYRYDAASGTIGYRDASGRTYTTTYDPVRRVATATGPGVQTSLQYDDRDRIVRLSTLNGGTKTFTYDDLHDAVQMTVNGATTSVATDDIGNPRRIVNALGATMTIAYDAASRRTAFTDPLGHMWHYHYAGDGSIAKLTAPSGADVALAPPMPAPQAVRITPLESLAHLSSSGRDVNFGYDAAGRLQTLRSPDLGVVSYRYTAAGQVAAVSAGGRDTTYAYDAQARLIHTVSPNGVTATFTYAACGALATMSYRDARQRQIFSQAYQYDGACRLTGTSGSAGTAGYGYDVLHRLTSVRDATHEIERYAYDAAGNLTADAVKTYAYDADGLPVSPAASRSESTKTRMVFVGSTLLETLAENGTPDTVYIPGTLADGWSEARRGGHTYTPIRSPLGTLLAVVDEHGAIAQRYTYDAFGMPLRNATAVAPEFDGHAIGEDGLIRFGARYYAPARRRFISPDPQGFDGGGNLYAFALNDPFNVTDESGAAPATLQLSDLSNAPMMKALPPQITDVFSAADVETARAALGGGANDPAFVGQMIDELRDVAANGVDPGAQRVAQKALDALNNGSELQARPGTRTAAGLVAGDDHDVALVMKDGIAQRATREGVDPPLMGASTGLHEIIHTTQDPTTMSALQMEWDPHFAQALFNQEVGIPLPRGATNLVDLRDRIAHDYQEAGIAQNGIVKAKGTITDDQMIDSFMSNLTQWHPPESYTFTDVESNVNKLRALRAAQAAENAAGAAPAVASEAGALARVLGAAQGGARRTVAAADAQASRALRALQNSKAAAFIKGSHFLPAAGNALAVVTADNWTDRAVAIASINPLVGHVLFAKAVADTTIEAGKALGNAAADAVIGAKKTFIDPLNTMFDEDDAEPTPTPSPRKRKDNGAGSSQPLPPGGGPPPPVPFPFSTPLVTPDPGASAEPPGPAAIETPAASPPATNPPPAGSGFQFQQHAPHTPYPFVGMHPVYHQEGTECYQSGFVNGPLRCFPRFSIHNVMNTPAPGQAPQASANDTGDGLPPPVRSTNGGSTTGGAQGQQPAGQQPGNPQPQPQPPTGQAGGDTSGAQPLPQTQDRPAPPAPAVPPPAAPADAGPPAPAIPPPAPDPPASSGSSYRPWWWDRLVGPPALPPEPDLGNVTGGSPPAAAGSGGSGGLIGAWNAVTGALEGVANSILGK